MIKILFSILFAFSFIFNPIYGQKKEKEKTETVIREKKNFTFPKPKNAWQVGVFGGVSTLLGDATPNFFFENNPALPGHNFGLFVSKSWSYLISTRLRYSTLTMFTNNAVASTLTQNQYSSTIRNNDVGLVSYTPGEKIFHNSRTQGHDLNFDLVFTMGNINFHKKRSPVVFRAFPSIGVIMYQTFYDHLDANNNKYDYNNLSNLNDLGVVDRTEIIKQLAAMRDGVYETKAEEHSVEDERKILGYNPRFTFGIGAGMAIRLTDYMSLDIESRQTFLNDDLLDGVQWQEPNGTSAASRNRTNNLDSYNQTTIGLTFSLISKKIGEPLSMQNPLWGADVVETKKDDIKDLTAKTDSTTANMEGEIDDLKNDINNLKALVEMMAKKNAEREEQDKLDAAEREKNAANSNVNNNGSNLSGTNNIESINDLNDPEYKHRNGDYIYVANLTGDTQAAYYLIIGSFRIKSNAKRDQRSWKKKGIDTYLMTDVNAGLYRVVVDYTNNHAAALDMLDEYKSKLDKTIWLIKAK